MFVIDKNYQPLDRLTAWDETTRQLIEDRIKYEIGDKPSFIYLSDDQGLLLQKISVVLLGQSEAEFRIKIAESIDRGLTDKKLGVKFAEDPWPGEFYKQGLLEFSQRFSAGREFDGQDVQKIVSEILDGEKQSFLADFLRRVLNDSAKIYYSHPDSWAKIGFPGPAFPVGYAFLDCDQKEDWEPNFKEA